MLKTLRNSPKLRIIDFFLDNPFFDFTKKGGDKSIVDEQADVLQILQRLKEVWNCYRIKKNR
ncbi:hypothetical protein KEJ27_02410 [Candidatus Bathyarchaeota archaeon]|nr:hypothetical protein [Candidatus Bathyarchaeota archaeon]